VGGVTRHLRRVEGLPTEPDRRAPGGGDVDASLRRQE
jgi:hypothetical protein